MSTALLRAIRVQVKVDSSPTRLRLFKTLLSQSPIAAKNL